MVKLSRSTKNWLRVQGEVYDKFLGELDRPGVLNDCIMSRLQETIDQTKDRLKKEGLDEVEIEAYIRMWIGGAR